MDIIVFAIIAILLFLKLRSELGKFDEEERKRIEDQIKNQQQSSSSCRSGFPFSFSSKNNNQQQEEKIVGQKSTFQDYLNKNSEIKDEKILSKLDVNTRQEVEKIVTQNAIVPSLLLANFESIFETIIKSFSEENELVIKNLLDEKIYKIFEETINQRRLEKQKLITNLISIDTTEILSAMTMENSSSVVIKFISRQINYVLDSNANVINGSKNEIFETTDIWTFIKENNSNNWIVSATNPN